jgi:hypothetical protein
MVESFAVQADSLRFQAVMALCPTHRDWKHLFQVHQESTGTSMTRKVNQGGDLEVSYPAFNLLDLYLSVKPVFD